MHADGSKTFDMRRWDISDDRIYRLTWGLGQYQGENYHPDDWIAPHLAWRPTEPLVSFQNKATGAVLTFQYKGMEFASWAPGWVFLILGAQVT